MNRAEYNARQDYLQSNRRFIPRNGFVGWPLRWRFAVPPIWFGMPLPMIGP